MYSVDFSTNFSKGQTLCIELEDRQYYGNFFFRSKDNARIELTNVRTDKNETGSNKRMIFYRAEVQSVKSETQPIQEENNIGVVDQLAVQVEAEISNYTYISEFRGQYHAAIADLQDQDFVGLNMEGNSLLVMAANQKIYIFDMLRLGRLRTDLKQILENNSPLKVVHNGGQGLKRLRKDYHCAVTPVFDTQVAHLNISSCEDAISTEKCVNLYLQVGLLETDAIADDIRSENQLVNAAKRVAFLVKLFDHLVHEILLKKMSASCQKYVTSLSKVENLSDAGFQIRSGSNPSIKLIEDFERMYVL